ncbi:MAG: adenylyltransferase/cytidyltransferase family protein [Candidatus Marinimicrobia bacterium]|jgi:rfaE bifunctional protein kinase chain/domain|nr:adenylyltransferase/cytidyltransferase family protein [Gammaproteobacteria bacterium]MBT4945948.1 adenylyltransferase/cytidyltransferase family protein [Candidatus Neomarinimicrobiota bacterium]MBT5370609.1 adenylyltransferase/cytidyltransferase family protein [Gammaproteobacteria bacterium]MBT5747084.1 adenylyltransferase/cytidyltransferase family protein [Gammaproteobacteria bacterium]
MNDQKTVLVSGHFNVLHPGHLRLLRFAAECGDRLIVAIESDRIAGEVAHVPEQLRLEGVVSNSWVDEAFLIDEPASVVVGRLRPDIVVKGKEHQSRFNPEQEIVESYGGRLLFGSGESTFSSIDLLRKEFYQSTVDEITLPLEFLARHSIEVTRLVYLLQHFASLKVCVVGDIIVDEYITCEPLGMSQEDPTIVVTPVDTTRFVGGAGIVAAHAAGLGAQVEFVTITGTDEARDYVQDTLEASGVNAHLIEDGSRPTTIKQRFRSKGKSLLRVSHLHQTAISPALQSKVLDVCESVIQEVDLLIFSDFNYGCLPQCLVDKIVQLAKSHSVMLVADSQSSSQVGDISRFQEMDLITPTEREARISTRNHEDGLVVLAETLRKQSSACNVLLKIGEEGLLIHAGKGMDEGWLTDRVCALNRAARDVAGAGDSLLVGSALTLASGGSIWESSVLGALAAAIQVGRVGNIPLQTKELLKELQ